MRARCAWVWSAVFFLAAVPAVGQSFQQNSYGLAVPPFGGYAPDAGATFGNSAGGGFFFQQNSYGLAIPPFGGYQPEAGATFGFGIGGGGANFSAAQGSRSSMSAQSVSGTLSNGAPLSVIENSQTPFVLGTIPVVGQGGASPLAERVGRLRQGEKPGPRGGNAAAGNAAQAVAHRQAAANKAAPPAVVAAGGGGAVGPSSAEKPALSVAEIRRQQQWKTANASVDTTSQDLVERAEQAASEGKTGAARVYYQQALRRLEGPQKQQVQERLDALR